MFWWGYQPLVGSLLADFCTWAIFQWGLCWFCVQVQALSKRRTCSAGGESSAYLVPPTVCDWPPPVTEKREVSMRVPHSGKKGCSHLDVRHPYGTLPNCREGPEKQQLIPELKWIKQPPLLSVWELGVPLQDSWNKDKYSTLLSLMNNKNVNLHLQTLIKKMSESGQWMMCLKLVISTGDKGGKGEEECMWGRCSLQARREGSAHGS